MISVIAGERFHDILPGFGGNRAVKKFSPPFFAIHDHDLNLKGSISSTFKKRPTTPGTFLNGKFWSSNFPHHLSHPSWRPRLRCYILPTGSILASCPSKPCTWGASILVCHLVGGVINDGAFDTSRRRNFQQGIFVILVGGPWGKQKKMKLESSESRNSHTKF